MNVYGLSKWYPVAEALASMHHKANQVMPTRPAALGCVYVLGPNMTAGYLIERIRCMSWGQSPVPEVPYPPWVGYLGDVLGVHNGMAVVHRMIREYEAEIMRPHDVPPQTDEEREQLRKIYNDIAVGQA